MTKKKFELKVLNIAQPNAHSIFHDGKNVENRKVPSYYRGTIAIYASATKRRQWIRDSQYNEEDLVFGAIIGFVDIVDCIVESEVTAKTKKMV